jgi:hypothetical protein
MNPIARIMKQFIKTPLKYALPLLFIGALVLTSTSGCVSTTNTTKTQVSNISPSMQAIESPTVAASQAATAQRSTPTPTPKPTPNPSSNALSTWDNAFTKAGYEIVKPFKQNVDKNQVITGTVNDGNDKLKPYKYDVSVREVATRDEAKAAFNAAITKAQQQGYQSGSINIDPDRTWSGYLGNQGFHSDKIVEIHIEEPDKLLTEVWDPFVFVLEPHTMYYVETTYSTANS